jgi:hypothetical protein
LGQNVREWCPGNPGDFVRQASVPSLTMNAWTGLSKDRAYTVIDCLAIFVFDSIRDCVLEKIVFVHKPTQRPTDTMGVHYSVFGVSLEVEQRLED